MSYLTKLFANALFRKVLMWGAISAVTYFLGTAIIGKVSDVLERAEGYEQMQQEALEANNALVQAKADAKAEVERMQADRDSLNHHIDAIKARAKLEQQEYERLLQSKPENKAWADSALPSDIKRLRETRFNQN